MWGSAFFMSDRTGPISLQTSGLNASMHYYLGGNNYIQVGLSMRLSQSSLDRDKLRIQDADDPVISDNFSNEWFWNSGIGVFYTANSFYIGASIPNTVIQDRNNLSRGLSDHYYGVIGGYIPLGVGSTYLEPSLWLRTSPDYPVYYNMGLRLRSELATSSEYGHPVWLGMGYDSVNAIHVELGFWYEKIKFNIISTHYLGNGATFGSGLEGGINLVL